MPPLTDFAPSRSHITSLTKTSPLTELNSRPCALMPLPRTWPLTLPIDTSVSVDTPENDTSPDTLLAASSFGVSVAVTWALTVSARTPPRTPVTFTEPDTEWSSSETPLGTVIVYSTDTLLLVNLGYDVRTSTRPGAVSTSTRT